MTPRVSIVTPTYNQGHFIGETIESVLKQDYDNLEYIIVDGQSSDNTLEVIARYQADPRLQLISEPDEGMSDALNKGFARSTGDIMGWLNSDDILLGQPIQSSVDYLDKHPEIDLVYGDVQLTAPDGTALTAQKYGANFSFIDTLTYYTSIPQPGTLWRRRLWERAGPIRQDLHYVMDIEFWLRASKFGEFAYLPGLRATYRQHEASKTVSDGYKVHAERLKILDEILTQQPELASHKRRIDGQMAHLLTKAHLFNGDKQGAREQARLALRKSPFSRRWVYLALVALDVHFGTSLQSFGARVYRPFQVGKR